MCSKILPNKNKLTSVLICVRNSEKIIKKTLLSIKKNQPNEIILIDGSSTDKTVKIAKKFTNKIFYDNGLNLGLAKNIGLQHVKNPYLVMLGPDDILENNFISKAVNEIESSSKKTFGLLAPKTIKNAKNFYEKGQNAIYKLSTRYTLRTIGVPCIIKMKCLKYTNFDKSFSANEDTDLSERLHRKGYIAKWGLKFKCFEFEKLDRLKFYKRYTWYGRGDFNFCKKWIHKDINVSIRHFFHPFLTYFLKYGFYFLRKGYFKFFLFTSLCAFLRYYGFFCELKKTSLNFIKKK